MKGELATGQVFRNFTLSDTTPDGVVVLGAHLAINGVTIGTAVTITQNADGTTGLVGNFPGSITGGTQVPTMVIDWYATEFLHDGTPVLDPARGGFRPLADDARLQANWTPNDTRDTDPTPIDINPAGAEDIVTAKSIAIQKGVALISGDVDGNLVPDWQPHGVLEYTLMGQVSNYFEMNGLVVNDTLGDGQSFDASFAPTAVIREGGVVIYRGPVLYGLGAKTSAGTTPVAFDISRTLLDAGKDAVLDGNGGGLREALHATNYNQATIQVVFHTTLDETWTATGVDAVPGDPLVDQGDSVRNTVLYAGDVLATGHPIADNSAAGVTLPVNTVSKSIYAINGDTAKGTTSFATPSHVQAGDLITFRLGLDIPLTSSHVVNLRDYLPLPVLTAADPDGDGTASGFSFIGIADATSPGAGVVKYGPGDTFHTAVPGVTPTLLADASGNSLTLDFGGATNGAYPATHLDLLVTLRVNDRPFGDGLLLTNQVTSSETNSFLVPSVGNAIIQFVLGEPALKITKGVIGLDNPLGTFLNATTGDASTGPVSFTAPGSSGVRFSGTINSTTLAGHPVDANLSHADAGDTVSFAIIVENRGQGWKGAFDALIKDQLPAGFTIPPGGLHLSVTDGTGATLAYGGSTADLFGTGIRIDDPGVNQGGIGTFDATSGRNIVVITYDLRLADTLAVPDLALTNTATIAHYAAEEGGTDRTAFDSLPNSDIASVTVLPTITKMVSATSLAATTKAQGDAGVDDLAIGETVTYTITVRMPEGIQGAVHVDDFLPTVNGQIKAISATVTQLGGNLSGNAALAVGQTAVLADTNADGVADRLSFDFGTVTNTVDNLNDANDTVTITVVGQLTKDGGNAAGDLLVNTATVSAANPADASGRISQSATATVEVVEPHLTITKSVSPTSAVDAADTLVYAVVLTNSNATSFNAPAFDVLINDLLSQIGPNAQYQFGSASIISGPGSVIGGNTVGDTSLTVSVPELDPGQSVRIQFKAKMSDTAISGQSVSNTAAYTAGSLPGVAAEERPYGGNAAVSVKVTAASVTKVVAATSYDDTAMPSAPANQLIAVNADLKVDEVATYTITVTIPEGTSVDFRVIDQLMDQVATGDTNGQLLYVPGSAKVVSVGANLFKDSGYATPLTAADAAITNTNASGSAALETVIWAFGTIYNNPDSDHGAATGADRITLEIQAKAADVLANQSGDLLTNKVQARAADNANSNTATATVDFVQAHLAVDKTVAFSGGGTTGDAGDIATYTVTIRHAADSTAKAYDLDLADVLQPGVQYVAGSLSAGATISGNTLSFHLDELALGAAAVTLTYRVKLLDGVVHGQGILNTASLDYQTHAPGQVDAPGRLLAASDAALIGVVITDTLGKTITGTDNAFTTGGNLAVGETVTYVLTATLGEGSQHLVLRDALPTGLGFVSSQVLSLGGITGSGLGVGAMGSVGSGGVLSFDFGDVVNPGDNDPLTGVVTVQVVAKVVAGTAAGVTLTNTATLAPLVGPNGAAIDPTTAMPAKTASVGSAVVAARVGNFIFEDLNANGVQDSGETGLAGVKVELIDTASGLVVSSTTTIGSGLYSFTNLVPGSYREVFTAPATGTWFASPQGAGIAATDSDPDATGQGAVFTLTDNQSDQTHDAGFFRKVSLGDFAFVDSNANGVQDSGEAGLAGVTVQLLDAGGNPVVGAVVTTGGNGAYAFTGLLPGSYGVTFSAPAVGGHVLTAKDQGGNDATDSDADTGTGKTLVKPYVSGNADTSVDAGFYVPAKLGDFAFVDANGNGVQDGGEGGLAGAVVKLYRFGTTTLVGTATTDANGAYGFTGLKPGDYYETFQAPSGFVLTKNGAGSAATDSDPGGVGTANGTGPKITLVSGDNDTTHDAGFYAPISIGDRVFNDLNGDGKQGSGEPGIDGVGVTLVNGGGATVATTTTAGGGAYGFGGLAPGDYAVRFATPAGYTITAKNAGGDDAADSDIGANGLTPTRTYASGTQDSSVDAGFWRPAAIGDRVFLDANGNGIQDSGEAGVDGIAVELRNAGGLVASTTTAGGGAYHFTGLVPGDYQVKFIAPSGYAFTTRDQGGDLADSDANPLTGISGTYSLVSGQIDDSVDAGLFQPVSIGDRAWVDADGDGIQGLGEPGLAGVTVTLINDATGATTRQLTDASGNYLFTGLPPGSYHEVFGAPAGYVFTRTGAGTAATDSDPDALGVAPGFSIASGQADRTRDAGLYGPPRVGGTVTLGLPPGICDDKRPDAVFAGIVVKLLNGPGAVVATTSTAADGTYHFEGLVPGTYAVQFVAPPGVHFSTGVSAAGLSASMTLVSGDAITGLDAGMHHLTGTIFDTAPVVPPNGNALDVNVASNIAFGGAGQVNLNAPGSYIVGGTGGLTASSNHADQYVIGGSGFNVLHGGSNGAALGGSILVGGAGDTVFEGTSGNDIIIGGCGTNVMQGLGSVGVNAPHGLAGFDILVGGRSGDTIEGNNGTSVMFGAAGNDEIHGDGTLIGGSNTGTLRYAGGVFSDLRIGDHLNAGNQADTFVYQKGDGVQWIENYKPAEGDSLQVYGYATPLATGTHNGFTVLYFGPNEALLFNGVTPYDNVTYFAHQDSMSGAFGHFMPLPPVELAASVGEFYGTQGDDIVIGSARATTFWGNGGDNLLIGGAGGDSFHGGTGNTTMIGNGGADVFFGGSGDDTYYVDSGFEPIFEAVGGGQDMVISTASFALFANIENLTLAIGAGDLNGFGNTLDNVLIGNEGANVLLAYAGDDVVSGGGGNDLIYGMEGNDSLEGGAGVDAIVGGIGADTLKGGADADALYGGDGNDSLEGGYGFSTDILVGGEGNDTLNGASGFGDYDLMDGGNGDDTYVVDTPADLVFEAPAGGIDTVIADIAGAGYYLWPNIENLVLRGITPFGVGNALGNHLTGSDLSNWLLGGAGNDTLGGKGGNDVLFGEAGADTFVFERGTGGDVIGDFQVGVDHIRLQGLGFASFADVQASLVENAGTTAINLGLGDFIVINGVANASLTAADFVFA